MVRRTSFLMCVIFLCARGGTAGFFSKHTEGGGPQSLLQGSGVRSATLGGAYVALADDPSGPFWNPSGIQQIETQELQLTHAKSFGDREDGFLGYVRPFWAGGARRTFGASLSVSSIGPIDLLTEGKETGTARPFDSTLAFSYAQALGRWQTGMTVKTVKQDTGVRSAWAAAMDFGILTKGFGDRLSVGLNMSNLGTDLDWGDRHTALPVVCRAGWSWEVFSRSLKSGVNRMLWVGELDYPSDHDWVPRTGVEYSLSPSKTLRMAFRAGVASLSGPEGAVWSGGSGLEMGNWMINFGYVPQGDLGAETRLDVLFKFGKEIPQERNQKTLYQLAKNEITQGHLLKAQKTVTELRKISPHYYEGRLLEKQLKNRFSSSLDPDVLMDRGRQAYEAGQWSEAVNLLRKVAILEPDREEAQQILAKAENKLGAAEESRAKEKLEIARRQVAHERAALAREAARLKKWSEAVDLWRKAMTVYPGLPKAGTEMRRCQEALYVQADQNEKAGDLVNALALFRVLGTKNNEFRDATKRMTGLEKEIKERRLAAAQESYKQGVAAYVSGRLDEARAILREAKELAPEDKKILHALERVERALEIHPSPPRRVTY